MREAQGGKAMAKGGRADSQVTLGFGVDSFPADFWAAALKSGKQRWPDSAATLRVQSFACEIYATVDGSRRCHCN